MVVVNIAYKGLAFVFDMMLCEDDATAWSAAKVRGKIPTHMSHVMVESLTDNIQQLQGICK